MNALRKFSGFGFAALLAACLSSSCAHRNAKPTASAGSQSTVAVVQGAAVTFSVAASGTPPLAYQWQFNGTNVPGVTNGPAVTNK
jgi:hypothetical protein